MIVSEQLNYIKTRRFHAVFMPVIIEFSRCIGIYSSAKFELGLTTLKTGQRNNECVPKIVKTLIAMGNTFPDKEATILIGVANNLQAAKHFKDHYRTNWIQVGECYVTGIDEEIKKYWRDKEEYYDYIKM